MQIEYTQDALTSSVVRDFTKRSLTALLERSFRGRKQLDVRALAPGISGASVLLVRPVRDTAQQPCVVKIGPFRKIQAERRAYRKYARPYIRNQHIPGMRGGVATDGDLGAIVYLFFADRTLGTLLAQYQQSLDFDSITAKLFELFELLKLWNREKHDTYADLVSKIHPATAGQIISYENRMRSLADEYPMPIVDWAGPRRLWFDRSTVSTELIRVGPRHGDLHGNNVLVDENGNLCLIDFGSTRPDVYYLKDFATLEADLVLRSLSSDMDYGKIERMLRSGLAQYSSVEAFRLAPDLISQSSDLVWPTVAWIRERAWQQMESKTEEIPMYLLAVARRMLLMVVTEDNGLTQPQRWLGGQLVATAADTILRNTSTRGSGVRPLPAKLKNPEIAPQKSAEPLLTAALSDLGRRLRAIGSTPAQRVALVGSVYLDIELKPIDTARLTGYAWSNLNRIDDHLGGSVFWVGQYLYRRYRQQSLLLSIVGAADDWLSQRAHALLNREPWIDNDLDVGAEGTATPVSVHLVHRKTGLDTSFTHRGALHDLTWDYIERGLNDLSGPALVYLAGYFRTDLYTGLCEHLERHRHHNVIAIDHGNIPPDAPRPAILALQEAFGRGLVDIYMCSWEELWTLAHGARKRPRVPAGTDSNVRELLNSIPLPTITVVRGQKWPGLSTAYIKMADGIQQVNGKVVREKVRASGATNAFNATLLHVLTHPSGGVGVAREVPKAARAALEAWQTDWPSE